MNLLDFIFPPKCAGCQKKGDYLCADCQKKLAMIDKLVCPACERPSMGGAVHPCCQKKYCLDGLISLFFYQNTAKKLIKKLKYKFVYHSAARIVDLMRQFLDRKFLPEEMLVFRKFLQEKPLLIPVPLHPARERWRGFNQSALMGEMLAKKSGLPFCQDLLVRLKNTKPQVELKGKARLENIKDAFAVKQKYLCKKKKLLSRRQRESIIIFDDVWTTGATLRNCGNILKRAGAKKVWALTLTR